MVQPLHDSGRRPQLSHRPRRRRLQHLRRSGRREMHAQLSKLGPRTTSERPPPQTILKMRCCRMQRKTFGVQSRTNNNGRTTSRVWRRTRGRENQQCPPTKAARSTPAPFACRPLPKKKPLPQSPNSGRCQSRKACDQRQRWRPAVRPRGRGHQQQERQRAQRRHSAVQAPKCAPAGGAHGGVLGEPVQQLSARCLGRQLLRRHFPGGSRAPGRRSTAVPLQPGAEGGNTPICLGGHVEAFAPACCILAGAQLALLEVEEDNVAIHD
mmetsp:Transcript_66658/g.216931  ORF Transcript_66658/g.216931 Transcript_66658/m.216931 type:complete len:267 (+) Transcript_66658:189-989(+)